MPSQSGVLRVLTDAGGYRWRIDFEDASGRPIRAASHHTSEASAQLAGELYADAYGIELVNMEDVL